MTTLILTYFLINTILAVYDHITASEMMKKYYQIAGNNYFLMIFAGIPIYILRLFKNK
jgi:phosphate starvation-inducible membrane PsiE